MGCIVSRQQSRQLPVTAYHNTAAAVFLGLLLYYVNNPWTSPEQERRAGRLPPSPPSRWQMWDSGEHPSGNEMDCGNNNQATGQEWLGQLSETRPRVADVTLSQVSLERDRERVTGCKSMKHPYSISRQIMITDNKQHFMVSKTTDSYQTFCILTLSVLHESSENGLYNAYKQSNQTKSKILLFNWVTNCEFPITKYDNNHNSNR